MENISKGAAASRANGAKSRRHRTAAGKKRSSLSAIRHGYLSKCVVLDSDDKVEEMVAAQWRLGRLGEVEGQLFNDAFKNLILLRRFKPQADQELPNEPEHDLPNETLMSGRSSPEMKTAGSNGDFSRSDPPLQLIESKGPRKVFSEEPRVDKTNPRPLPNEPRSGETQKKIPSEPRYQPPLSNLRSLIYPGGGNTARSFAHPTFRQSSTLLAESLPSPYGTLLNRSGLLKYGDVL